ncbi:MAG: glycosyltransferase family 1 protein [Planctomycetia bacterium]|nr:glycosyltransferase family 1 protein [Planctomycetia bacterium]
MSKIARLVVTSHGSIGDLHPYIAIALGLQARGHEAIFATGECYRKKIEDLGLSFRPVRPDCNWLDDPVVMRRITHPRWGLARVIRELWLPALRESYDDTLAAMEGADLLVAMQVNYSARLVAEKTGLPWVSAMHIPFGLSSAYDPPVFCGFEGVSRALRILGPPFWKPLRRVAKWATSGWARPYHRLRHELGLPRDESQNPLTDGFAPRLHLALFSPCIADKQPDWPPQTIVTGFPWFDRDAAAGLPAELSAFLDADPPPIVFTLGTAVSGDGRAQAFFEHSAAAAKALGRRAVLILNDPRNRPHELPEGVIAVPYAPFLELFPHAIAIVHHGGIGTTGLAMRAGRPMLIMPCAWDQPDNAERAARLGIARTISRNRYTASRVAAELKRLLDDPSYSRRATEVGGPVRQENGVRVACDALESLLPTAAELT